MNTDALGKAMAQNIEGSYDLQISGCNADIHYVDVRGHHCPIPLLRLAQALRLLNADQYVTLDCDDPQSLLDIKDYCVRNQHHCEVVDIADSTTPAWRFMVRKCVGISHIRCPTF